MSISCLMIYLCGRQQFLHLLNSNLMITFYFYRKQCLRSKLSPWSPRKRETLLWGRTYCLFSWSLISCLFVILQFPNSWLQNPGEPWINCLHKSKVTSLVLHSIFVSFVQWKLRSKFSHTGKVRLIILSWLAVSAEVAVPSSCKVPEGTIK